MAAQVTVRQIASDSEFQKELALHSQTLVVVDFFATWCGPCRVVAPKFEELSRKYSKAVFLKIDVDQCQNTASRYGIRSMPSFGFFKEKEMIHLVKGADIGAVEATILQHLGAGGGSTGGPSSQAATSEGVTVPGQHLLNSFIDKSQSECLNESDDHNFLNALSSGPEALYSDCDEQLVLYLSFNQSVKLHSLVFKGPDNGKAPKTVKLFINQISTPSFDDAERMKPIEKFILTEEQVRGDVVLPLTYVKYQNIQNLTIFIKDNMGGSEETVLQYLGLFGTPLDTTNMSDFKRVAGEAGESHF